MINPTKALALAAFALAGAFLGTAAQASAANFNVSFAIKNNDASLSMIRTSSVPVGVTGLPNPSVSIAPGGSESGTWSATLPALHASAQILLTYAQASDGVSSPCSFTVKISHDTNVQPYLLEFSNNGGPSRCSVPASARTSDGQFTSQTYTMGWST
jgi:hypothetical protein